MKASSLAACAAVVLLPGCSLLPGNSEFKCGTPTGTSCLSVGEVFKKSVQSDLVQEQAVPSPASGPVATTKAALPAYRTEPRSTPSSGSPVRVPPRLLRIWMAPWEDKEGDVHDHAYLWVTVDTGRWLLDQNRRQIQQAYRPVLAPSAPAASAVPTTPARPGSASPSVLPMPSVPPLIGMPGSPAPKDGE